LRLALWRGSLELESSGVLAHLLRQQGQHLSGSGQLSNLGAHLLGRRRNAAGLDGDALGLIVRLDSRVGNLLQGSAGRAGQLGTRGDLADAAVYGEPSRLDACWTS
jgi:hypothetical protein